MVVLLGSFAVRCSAARRQRRRRCSAVRGAAATVAVVDGAPAPEPRAEEEGSGLCSCALDGGALRGVAVAAVAVDSAVGKPPGHCDDCEEMDTRGTMLMSFGFWDEGERRGEWCVRSGDREKKNVKAFSPEQSRWGRKQRNAQRGMSFTLLVGVVEWGSMRCYESARTT